ncbi:hypothetical protein Pmani_006288 [Petrolisthes manimaculis]|uniref:Ubiquitin-conjugating enzyme E2 Z n=1 Tax=Petrolisthes manimaculis TaxID=1843537 RepID=A0AAE1QAK1_9EUCA|nr:hypothetical protein Pmani_006288 [Petrolisthes manimaculis]
MEPESTVAEADSTLVLPPSEPFNLTPTLEASTPPHSFLIDTSSQDPTPSLPVGIDLMINESSLYTSSTHSDTASGLFPSSSSNSNSTGLFESSSNSNSNGVFQASSSSSSSHSTTSPHTPASSSHSILTPTAAESVDEYVTMPSAAQTPTGTSPAYPTPSSLPPTSLIPSTLSSVLLSPSDNHNSLSALSPSLYTPTTQLTPLGIIPPPNTLSSIPLPAPSSDNIPATIGNTLPSNPQDPGAVHFLDNMVGRHDPLASPDWDRAGPPGNLCAGRVRKDLSSIFTDPLPGIFAVPEDGNMFKVHCLIIGPFDTPYEGGFFHFLVRFGPQYPLHPPRVKLLTTGGGSVRFNPNLYRNGKVCLSILGTWPGPAWSPASNLSSVLLSLQSLMNERPYHNEPGYEEERNIGDSERYNSIITHETLRVAVIQQLEGPSAMPSDLLKVMQESFMEYYDHYVDICHKNMHNDGQTMNDPFGELRGQFHYSSLLKQLRRLKTKLRASGVAENLETSGGGGTESEDASSISGSEEDGSPEP